MKAVRVNEFGGPQVLKVESDVAIPVPNETQVGERIILIILRYVINQSYSQSIRKISRFSKKKD